jgi:hypothetical protein
MEKGIGLNDEVMLFADIAIFRCLPYPFLCPTYAYGQNLSHFQLVA